MANKAFYRLFLWIMALQFSPALVAVENSDGRIDGETTDLRCNAFLNYCATLELKENNAKYGIVPCLARILTNQELPQAIKKWAEIAKNNFEVNNNKLIKNPSDSYAIDPFEKHALVHAYMMCMDKNLLTEEIIQNMKKYVCLYKHRQWIGYGALNYRLMNDGAGFIAAECWPDLMDRDGLNSVQIFEATKTRLLGYFKDIVHYNNDEYGAPTYLGIDLSAMKLLADYAKDPEVKYQATLTLDSMLLHVACAWNNGYYVTPASRSKYFGSTMTGPDGMDATSAIAWLSFGGSRPVLAKYMNPPGAFWFSVKKNYQCPDLIKAVANKREKPFVHQGSVKENIRYTIYHQSEYSLASEWEFLSGPTHGHYKESRRNILKWISPFDHSTFAPMQDNARRPYRLQEKVANAFGYGENPYSQSLQFEGTLISISNVPQDYPYWKQYTPFTRKGAIVKRLEKENWVFCHGGNMLFAFRYLTPAYWGPYRPKENCDVYCSDDRLSGWILETSPLDVYASGNVEVELQKFSDQVLKKTRLDVSGLDNVNPSFTFRNLGGHPLSLTYRPHGQAYVNQHKVDGQVIAYAKFPLLGNPWVHQDLGDEKLNIRMDGKELKYNFKTWSRK
jgi:hypothetical protein